MKTVSWWLPSLSQTDEAYCQLNSIKQWMSQCDISDRHLRLEADRSDTGHWAYLTLTEEQYLLWVLVWADTEFAYCDVRRI